MPIKKPSKARVVENLDAETESPAQLKAFKAKMKVRNAATTKRAKEDALVAKKYGVKVPSKKR